jgi:hypothetical protein
MAAVMQGQLRQMGYEEAIEQSLQIRRVGEPDRYPISDVSIYDTQPARAAQGLFPTSTPLTGFASVPTLELLDISEEDISYYRAIGIYETRSRGPQGSTPIAWIELLSPSNKPGGRDFERYIAKRGQILQTAIVFVEIDYLHEQPSTFKKLPSYIPRQRSEQLQPGASPYLITVIDPRPELDTSESRLYAFHVDDALPVVDIPLNAADVLTFDFGTPYQQSFETMYYGDKVDYSQLPVNFDRYREPDQARIVSRMIAVLEAAQAGHNLEQSPQRIETLPLADGLQRLKALVPEIN